MKSLLEFLAKSIVPNPESVTVDQSEEKNLTFLKLKVHPDDLKIIIGKEGRTIRAIREIMRIKALALKKRLAIQVEEPETAPQ